MWYSATHAQRHPDPKQARFVEEYLVDLNGTQAAIRAGYARSGAQQEATRLLTNPDIHEAITEARSRLSQRTEITQDEVMAEFAKIGFADSVPIGASPRARARTCVILMLSILPLI
jgi:hypothetical protein